MNSPQPADTASDQSTHKRPGYTLRQLVLYFLRLGTFGFGGPVALAGYMHRDLVDARQWITDADYKEGIALAQLAPGPMAAQLAIYLGYVHYRILGATLVGIAFVLPSFLMVLALGWAYTRFGGLTWMQSVFYGVGAAVIGIIAISAYKLTKKSVGKDKLLWCIYLVLAAVTVITESEVAWLFLAAGVLVWFWRAPPKWFRQGKLNAMAAAPLPAASGLLSTVDWPLLSQIGVFFAKAGAFVFGSGLAIVPFLYGGVVTEHHWLNDKQFVDAVAVAMITPGPVVITVGFIGYLVAGLPGPAWQRRQRSCPATCSRSYRHRTSRNTGSCPPSWRSWMVSRQPPSARSRARSSCWPSARSSISPRCCWHWSPLHCC
jgi:chromate transporter